MLRHWIKSLHSMDTGQFPSGRSFSDDVDLYLLANYLDVPALEAFVINQCQTRYFAHSNAAQATMDEIEMNQTQGAVNPFRRLFSKTVAGDGLRLVLMRGILKWYKTIYIGRNEWITLFQSEEPNSWRVLCDMGEK